MKSRATPRFWTAHRELPPEIKELARKAYGLFRDSRRHPNCLALDSGSPDVTETRVDHRYGHVAAADEVGADWGESSARPEHTAIP